MKGFKQFIIEEQLLVEGGNSKAINRKTQEVIARPQRIDMSKVSRTDLRKKLLDLFKDLNIQFGKKYEEPLWPSMTALGISGSMPSSIDNCSGYRHTNGRPRRQCT